MRVVIAPFGPENEAEVKPFLRERGYEIACFGAEWRTAAAMLESLPAGWKPDIFLYWSLEYYPVPQGIEALDCFTAGIVGDWNLGGQAFQQIGGAFDLLIADRNGCETLRRCGFENVCYAPLWTFDPRLHRRIPGVPRDLDIVLVGSFNHAVQRERAKWLARVAKLSRKYRVCVTSGVHGEDYAQLMNRAKIVFNRSIRGEINMRAYEAPACGALLFYERENPEIHSLYTDREECVLYGEEDLEALLDYYLTHDAEREQIAEAGRRKVQSQTLAQHLAQMLDTLAAAKAGQADVPPEVRRPFLTLAPAEQERRRAYQWMLTPDRNNLIPAEQALLQARTQGFMPPALANMRGCLLGEYAQSLLPPPRTEALKQALGFAGQALTVQPDYLAARWNRAQLCFALNDLAEGERELRELLRQLKAATVRPDQLTGPYWPRRFESFEVELERVWGLAGSDTPEWTSAMQRLLQWRTQELLSDLAFERSCFTEAAQHAEAALRCRSDIGSTHYRAARAFRALGKVDEALEAYHFALQTEPFHLEARREAALLALDTERPEAALPLLEEWIAITEGCPIYAATRPEFERLRVQAQQQLQQKQQEVRPAPTRFLVFPDWNDPAHWQTIIRAFAETYRPEEAALLMLHADPERYPDAVALLRSLQTYLVCEMDLAADALPNITLLTQALQPADFWKLFYIADRVVQHGGLPPAFRAQADAMRVPFCALDELRKHP